jgi:mannose-6-phosphate isomerase-like protein (cupin superfamily)
MKKDSSDIVQIYQFHVDETKPGRVLSTTRIGDVYMSRLVIDPGVVTGNRYHKKTSRMFYVESGSILAVFEDVESQNKVEHKIKAGSHAIHIPPYTAFATKNIGIIPVIIVLFSNLPSRSDDNYDYHVLN